MLRTGAAKAPAPFLSRRVYSHHIAPDTRTLACTAVVAEEAFSEKGGAGDVRGYSDPEARTGGPTPQEPHLSTMSEQRPYQRFDG